MLEWRNGTFYIANCILLALLNELDFKNYAKRINIKKLLKELGTLNIDLIIKEVKYFTEREAERRDQILLNYFGEDGINYITKSIVNYLLSQPRLKADAKILDVGSGSGLFTIKVAKEINRYIANASLYAMDITPAMLSVLVKRGSEIIPFLGIAENISGSIEHARKYLDIPKRFDAVFSILTLHHCLDVKKVFKSIRDVVKEDGKVVIVDLCEHPFKEFKVEMGDVHLGFNLSLIKRIAKDFFSNVCIREMQGIICECSGRSAKLFIAHLTC
jgi:SAM-dependent methyltransferase